MRVVPKLSPFTSAIASRMGKNVPMSPTDPLNSCQIPPFVEKLDLRLPRSVAAAAPSPFLGMESPPSSNCGLPSKVLPSEDSMTPECCPSDEQFYRTRTQSIVKCVDELSEFLRLNVLGLELDLQSKLVFWTFSSWDSKNGNSRLYAPLCYAKVRTTS